MSGHHKRLQYGFTLTELVIVVVLLGIVAVAVLPNWSGRTSYDARGYFDQLLTAARYAQKLALVSNCEVRLTVTGGTGGGFVLQQPASQVECGSPASWQSVSLPAQPPPYDAPAGVTVVPAGPTTITFDAAGLASADQMVSVEGSHSFRVHAATGYVEHQ